MPQIPNMLSTLDHTTDTWQWKVKFYRKITRTFQADFVVCLET